MTKAASEAWKRRTSFFLPNDLRQQIDRQGAAESRNMTNMLLVLLARGLAASPKAEKGVLK